MSKHIRHRAFCFWHGSACWHCSQARWRSRSRHWAPPTQSRSRRRHCTIKGAWSPQFSWSFASAILNVDLRSAGFFWLGIMLWLTLADDAAAVALPAAHWGSSFHLRDRMNESG